MKDKLNNLLATTAIIFSLLITADAQQSEEFPVPASFKTEGVPRIKNDDVKHLFFEPSAIKSNLIWDVDRTSRRLFVTDAKTAIYSLDVPQGTPELRIDGRVPNTLRVSPTSSLVAFNNDKDNADNFTLFLWDGNSEPKKLSTFFGKDDSVDSFIWSRDGKSIFFTLNDYETKTTRLCQTDLKTSDCFSIDLKGLWNVLDVDRDNVLLKYWKSSSNQHIFNYSLADKKLTTLSDLGNSTKAFFVAGRALILNENSSECGGNLCLLSIDTRSGNKIQIGLENIRGHLGDIKPSPDGKLLLVQEAVDGIDGLWVGKIQKNRVVPAVSNFLSGSYVVWNTVLRAVMIEAIQKACATDIQHRCIVWLTLRNVIRFYTLGREKELLTGYLSQLANKIEDEATDKWSSGSPSDVSKVAVETSWAEPVGADAESLAKKLLTASGPTNKEGQAYAGTPNPQFPNSGGPWTYEFAPRAATAIATTINNAISRNLDGVQSGMEGFVSNVEAAVSKTLQDIVESNKFFGVRTHLLWWGEALYSRTFRKSYRDLPKGFLALGMACDYSEIMPAVYPVSGDFFLTESYRKLYEGADADKQIPIRELIEVYVANRSELRSLVTTARPPFSRISLLEFVRGLILDEFRIEDLESKVGIDPESKITEAEQVVWLFHDFQASKLTGTAR